MSRVQLSGLSGGLEWQGTVDKLMEIEEIPINSLRREEKGVEQKNAALDTLKTKLQALELAAKDLQSKTLYQGRTGTVLNTSNVSVPVMSATVASGTLVGSYRISVSQLATSSVMNGATGIAKPIATTEDVSGVTIATMPVATPIVAGTFTINGASVSIATTDSLQDVLTKISANTGGVVTAKYDPATDKLSLSGTSNIRLGSGADTSNFLNAMMLVSDGSSTTVKSQRALGAVQLNASLASSNLSTDVTAGSFSINNKSFTYTTSDTLYTLMSTVNRSTAGVNMSYDASTGKFVIANKATGSSDITVADDAGGGNLMSALGLSSATATLGVNALYTVNGGSTLSSASNTLTSNSHGISGLSVTVKQAGVADTVQVTADGTAATAKVNTFIDKYNDVQDFIATSTKVTVSKESTEEVDPMTGKRTGRRRTGKITKGPLAGNREVEALSSRLRQMAFETVNGLEGDVKRLEDMGISFKSDTKKLSVTDQATLKSSIENNEEAVTTLFTDGTQGLGYTFYNYTYAVADSTTGTIKTLHDSFDQEIHKLDRQIEQMKLRLENERARLEKAFLQLEKVQSTMNQQVAAIQRLGSMNFKK